MLRVGELEAGRAPAQVIDATPGALCLAIEDTAALELLLAALEPIGAVGPADGSSPPRVHLLETSPPSSITSPGGTDTPSSSTSTEPPRTGSDPQPEPEQSPRPRQLAAPMRRSGEGLAQRLEVMSLAEKIQLALHGDRAARILLVRERAGVVQSSLVRNPKVTLDEVQALARTPHLAPDAAELIAQHPSYGASPSIAVALVRNPRTPLPTATALIARLAPGDLRSVAKGLGVRTQVAAAARKRLLG